MRTIDEGSSGPDMTSMRLAAFQRRAFGVSNPAHWPKLDPRREAGVRDGLTNEFVDMFTYQVRIQTLQLSERSGT